MQILLAIVTRYSSAVVQFVIAVIAARDLPARDVGIYLSMYGIVAATCFIAGLGAADGIVKVLPALLQEEREGGEAAKLYAAYLRFGLWSSIPMAVGFGAAYLALDGSVALAAGAAVWWLGYALMNVGSQGLVAVGRVGTGAFFYYGSTNWGSIAAFGCYLALPGPAGLVGTVIAMAAGSCAAGGASFALAFASRPSAAAGDPAASPVVPVRIGFPLMAVRVVQGALMWSPVWCVGLMLGPSVAAPVGVASRLVTIAGGIAAAFRFSLRPQIVRLAARGEWAKVEGIGSRMAQWCTAVCLVALAGDLLGGRWLLPAVFGDGYSLLWLIVAVLMSGAVVEAMSGPSDELLKMTDGAAVVLGAQCVALVGGATAQILLGLTGNMWPMVASSALVFSAYNAYLALAVHRRRSIAPVFLAFTRVMGNNLIERSGRRETMGRSL